MLWMMGGYWFELDGSRAFGGCFLIGPSCHGLLSCPSDLYFLPGCLAVWEGIMCGAQSPFLYLGYGLENKPW